MDGRKPRCDRRKISRGVTRRLPKEIFMEKVSSPSHFLEPGIKFAVVSSRGRGRPGVKGEMVCGNLGEWSGRRDFPGDANNIHRLTSIKFLKQSVQQSDQIMTEKNRYTAYDQTISISGVSMQLLQLFLRRNYVAAFVFQFCNSTFIQYRACNALQGDFQIWLFSAFL